MREKVNQKILSQAVKYFIMSKNDIDESSTLISTNFVQREALCLHTAVKFSQFKYFANYLFMSDRLNKSIIAKSQTSNKIVGVLINQCASDLFQFQQQMGSGLKKMIEFSFELQKQTIDLLQVKRDKVFIMSWLAVAQQYQGGGIALKLINETIKLAIKLNYQYLITQLTSPLTQHLWKNKLNFKYKQHLLHLQKGKGYFLKNCELQDKIYIGVKKLDQFIV